MWYILVLLLQILLLHLFNDLFSTTTWVSWHQKGKLFWILLQQEMIGWQWHQLDHMQIIWTLLQTDNHASSSPLNFYRPDAIPRQTNSVKALKATMWHILHSKYISWVQFKNKTHINATLPSSSLHNTWKIFNKVYDIKQMFENWSILTKYLTKWRKNVKIAILLWQRLIVWLSTMSSKSGT